MKKNGFTLIEVIGTMVILSVILLMIYPVIRDAFNATKGELSEEQMASLENVARLWATKHSDKLSERKPKYLTIEELKRSGLVENKEILKMNSDEELTGCIKIYYENNKYNYKYENEENCSYVGDTRIPSGYQEVEYIESTGTQYIDTGLAENKAYGIRMSIKITGATTAWQSLVSGTIDNFTVGTKDTDTSGFYIRLRTMEVYRKDGVLSSGVNDLSIKNGIVNLNGSQIATYDHGALSTASNPIYIFANNSLSRFGEMRLYSLEFYDRTGKVIRDFIPCYRKNENILGLYDTVEGKFYSNNGSGNFKKGSNI